MISSDSIMANRGGLPIKNIITAAFIIASLYLLFIYNRSQNRLHESEMTGARYLREAEDRVSEIQELVKAKDDLQERCENDKRELTTRIKSINQQLSMLQSQHKETEADFMKLKQDMETMRSEHMQAENQHAQEYQDLKSGKDKIITQLDDQLKLAKKSNEDLQNTVISLRSQLQDGETLQQNLRDQNAKLQHQYQQQQLWQQQQQQQRQQQQPQQPQQQQKDFNQSHLGQEGQPQIDLRLGQGQMPFQNQQVIHQYEASQVGHGVQNMNIPGDNGLSNHQKGMGNLQAQPDENAIRNQFQNEGDEYQRDVAVKDHKDSKINALNAQHQVLPPGSNDNLVDEKNNLDKDVDLEQGEKRSVLNPNDLQKGQILEPVLDAAVDNKQDNGEDEGPQNSIRNKEKEREQEEMDNTFMEHKKPLNLGQMEQPGDLQHFEKEGEGLGQQRPPVMSNEDDKNDDKNDQQLYYQDEDVDKFIKEKNEDFDGDEEGDNIHRGNVNGKQDDMFNDGNDFAHIPQFNISPNRFNREDEFNGGRWLNADGRDEDYDGVKKFEGNRF